jgi:hypothetical protein
MKGMGIKNYRATQIDVKTKELGKKDSEDVENKAVKNRLFGGCSTSG